MPIKGVYLDTETGGLDNKGNALLAIGLCAFEVNQKVLEITNEFYMAVKPGENLSVSQKSLDVQGLTWEQFLEYNVRNGLDEEKAFNGLRNFLSDNIGKRPFDWKYRVHAWNAEFDYGFIRSLSNRVRQSELFEYKSTFTCSMQMWQQAYGMGLHTEPFASLDIACESLGIDIKSARANGHDAMIDARLGCQALAKMIEKGYVNVGD